MGYPDKVSDQISDGILDALLQQGPYSRVACETLCTTDLVVLSGEVTTRMSINHVGLVRGILHEIGYTSDAIGFNVDSCRVFLSLHNQSDDIAQWVDCDGAGDQGLMFGYACNQIPELIPLPIALSHRILNRLTDLRQQNVVDWLRPDCKSQVSVEYDGTTPVGVSVVVVSTQHSEPVTQQQIAEFIVSEVIRQTIPEHLLGKQTNYHVNPTGRFVVGGPHGDTGLTSRKIVVATYGVWGRHGGGAFSGKDPTKVDRSAACMARHVAKNIVAAGLADECEIQLAYAIGVADPISVHVETNATAAISDESIGKLIRSRCRGSLKISICGVPFSVRQPGADTSAATKKILLGNRQIRQPSCGTRPVWVPSTPKMRPTLARSTKRLERLPGSCSKFHNLGSTLFRRQNA